MDISIRTASPLDAAVLAALARQSETAAHWTEPQFSAALADSVIERITLVVEDTQTVRGFVMAAGAAGEWELENIVVSPEWQRRGLGSLLLQRLLQQLRQRDATSLFLEVRESNQAARALYERRGFRAAGRRKNYYDRPPEDALRYRFSLGSNSGNTVEGGHAL